MPTSSILTNLRLIRTSPALFRPFSQHPSQCYPRKDSQDKDSINTEATEYSKSGTDDQSARNEDSAFSRNVTRPEGEKKVAGKDNEGDGRTNPLDVSPANQEVSKPRGEQEGGAENSGSERRKQSGFGSGKKAGS